MAMVLNAAILEMIDLAGQVGDLSVVDINFPFPGGDVSFDEVQKALKANNLSVIGITPEIYTQVFRKVRSPIPIQAYDVWRMKCVTKLQIWYVNLVLTMSSYGLAKMGGTTPSK